MQGKDVEAGLAALEDKVQALSVAISTLIDDAESRRSPVVWTYDARFPIDAANIYEAEFWDHNIKRWVGPEPSLDIWPVLRAGRTYRLTVNVVDFITQEGRDTFGARINGIEVKLEAAGGGVFTATFGTDFDGEQSIVLHTDVAISPAELYGSEDQRKLSFSIANILIVEVK